MPWKATPTVFLAAQPAKRGVRPQATYRAKSRADSPEDYLLPFPLLKHSQQALRIAAGETLLKSFHQLRLGVVPRIA